ncbi:hypothetical protein ACUL41_03145 [Virgibacillus natechei]
MDYRSELVNVIEDERGRDGDNKQTEHLVNIQPSCINKINQLKQRS